MGLCWNELTQGVGEFLGFAWQSSSRWGFAQQVSFNLCLKSGALETSFYFWVGIRLVTQLHGVGGLDTFHLLLFYNPPLFTE